VLMLRVYEHIQMGSLMNKPTICYWTRIIPSPYMLAQMGMLF